MKERTRKSRRPTRRRSRPPTNTRHRKRRSRTSRFRKVMGALAERVDSCTVLARSLAELARSVGDLFGRVLPLLPLLLLVCPGRTADAPAVRAAAAVALVACHRVGAAAAGGVAPTSQTAPLAVKQADDLR